MNFLTNIVGRRTTVLSSIAFAGALALSACQFKLKPSFPAARLAQDLKAMCLHDYKMNVDTRMNNDTLQAFFWTVGLVSPQTGEMSPDAAESLERVVLCATRIALSTDAPLRFVEVKTSDVLTGGTITLWRYVPDIQDSMHNRMGEEEFLNRLVLDVDAENEHASSAQTSPWDHPISFPQFIAKQVIQRTKRQGPAGLQVHEDLSNPSTLTFIIDNWPAIADQGPKQKETVTVLVEKTAKTVVKDYSYKGFHGLVLQDAQGSMLGRWTL
jgi:hypothetical protein